MDPIMRLLHSVEATDELISIASSALLLAASRGVDVKVDPNDQGLSDEDGKLDLSDIAVMLDWIANQERGG